MKHVSRHFNYDVNLYTNPNYLYLYSLSVSGLSLQKSSCFSACVQEQSARPPHPHSLDGEEAPVQTVPAEVQDALRVDQTRAQA